MASEKPELSQRRFHALLHQLRDELTAKRGGKVPSKSEVGRMCGLSQANASQLFRENATENGWAKEKTVAAARAHLRENHGIDIRTEFFYDHPELENPHFRQWLVGDAGERSGAIADTGSSAVNVLLAMANERAQPRETKALSEVLRSYQGLTQREVEIALSMLRYCRTKSQRRSVAGSAVPSFVEKKQRARKELSAARTSGKAKPQDISG